MPERPILFSAPMVRALLEGRKTQTRRVAKFVEADGDCWHIHNRGGGMLGADDDAVRVNGPDFAPYAPGDRLWVKEAHSFGTKAYPDCLYRADDGHYDLRWRSSIHMPRWASRLTLLVMDVRVQRLQDISEEDAIAEGIVEHEATATDPAEYTIGPDSLLYPSSRDAYAALWNSLHGPDAWAQNPWVVAVSFEVRKGNIDG